MSAPVSGRFPYVIAHAGDGPPDLAAARRMDQRAGRDTWTALCEENDQITAALAGPYREAMFAEGRSPAPGDAPGAKVPQIMLLTAGTAAWALSGIRGILHQYLAEDGAGPDDPTAVFLQGMLVGGAFSGQVVMDCLFSRGYVP